MLLGAASASNGEGAEEPVQQTRGSRWLSQADDEDGDAGHTPADFVPVSLACQQRWSPCLIACSMYSRASGMIWTLWSEGTSTPDWDQIVIDIIVECPPRLCLAPGLAIAASSSGSCLQVWEHVCPETLQHQLPLAICRLWRWGSHMTMGSEKCKILVAGGCG